MKTPAGKECRYYYQDFHRGHSRQECRLIDRNTSSPPWRPGDCAACTVPEILWANASENLLLRAEVRPGLLGLGRHIKIEAACSKHDIPIEDPFVGCSQCNAERPGIEAILKE